MNERLQKLEKHVEALYKNHGSHSPKWIDWIYANHVLVVANYATELAKKHKANQELTRVAALLHDIADIKMTRESPKHPEESLKLAREIMREHGYSHEEIDIVVSDAIRYHSCHGSERPKSLEGKILATADAMAHFKTDFYIYFVWLLAADTSVEDIKKSTLAKIDRDLHSKIQFDEVRREVADDYDRIKMLFSR